MAQSWADAYATGLKRNGKPRSPQTAFGVISGAGVLWGEWLYGQLKIVPSNAFAEVHPPEVDKPPVVVPADDHLADFHTWLADRFGDWRFPHVYFRLKGLSASRLMDICLLRAEQVREGRVHFDEDQTKGRKARAVPLPADLYSELEAIKGSRYLWDRYPAELRERLRTKGWPTHRLQDDFDPVRMSQWVMDLFRDYRKVRPGWQRLTSHHFRKKAFTEAYRAGIPLHDAATAFTCDVETIRQHYLGIEEQEITNVVFAKLQARKQ